MRRRIIMTTTSDLNVVVLDIEIQDAIVNPADWDNTDKMKIACCVLYSYIDDRYHVYGPNDVERLRSILIAANRIVTFNGNKFDLPIIFNMPNRTFPTGLRSYDILANIWLSLHLDPTLFTNAHKGYSLDRVCKYTLGKGKSGSGAAAPFLFKQGDIWKVIDYCINDVALTVELYNYIMKNNCVITKSTNGILDMSMHL
jgi:DEAD/DEAH box helicase domain-containing protein